jgi:hypothetical protein
MKPDPIQPTNPQRQHRPLMLGRPNSRSTAPREQYSFRLRCARDQGVQAVGLDPHGRRLALARRASPLRSLALEFGAREGPLPVLARGRLVVATDDNGSLAKCRDRNDRAIHAPVWIGSLSYPLSMMAVLTANPRASVASISGSANVVSASLAVSTVQASGRPVITQTAAWTLRLRRRHPSEGSRRSDDPRGVRVGELLALGSVLGQEPLTVGVSREIQLVDSGY